MATKPKRANRSTNPLGTPAFKIPNGTYYKPTAADGALGGFAGMLPGSSGLSGGLTSSLPKTGNLGLYNSSAYLGFQTPTSSAYSPKAFQGVQATGGFGTNALINPAPTVQPKTFVSADGVVFSTTGAPQIPNTPSSFNQTLPQNTAAQPGTAARPQGVYNPNASNAQQWRDYWNAQAQNPTETEQAPKVMSRKQIWEMKARQRRKRIAEEYWDNNGSSPSVVSQPAPEVIAPQWTSAVNWRIASG